MRNRYGKRTCACRLNSYVGEYISTYNLVDDLKHVNTSMNRDLVEIFREKLDNLTISDYHGLNGPGLTCYLNSVLQVLFMTEDFRGSIKRCCSKAPTAIDALLGKLFDDLERSLAWTHCIAKKLGITDVYEQRDAAEYFEKILCLTSPEASKIFKGELNHKTTCVTCEKRNDSRGFFWILPLAMGNSCRQTYSVTRGLKAFFKKEKVSGENRIYCSQCDEKQVTDIDCEMTQKPGILTLLLKRFTFDYKCQSYVKLQCEVDVPQTLHMENCKYDLYALVNHFGDLTGGHYTAEIKSFETGEWYCFNDDIVERVKQPLFGSGNTPVRSCSAYLLMYRKESTFFDEVDQEAQCAGSGVEAEGRLDKSGPDEAPAPHRTPEDESGSGGENLRQLNGDAFKKSGVHSSGELEQRAACVRPHKDTLLRRHSETDGELYYEPNWLTPFSKTQKDGGHNELITNSGRMATHSVDRAMEPNHNSPKKRLKLEDVSWDTTGLDAIIPTTGTKTKCATDGRQRVKPAESKGVGNESLVLAEGIVEGKGIKQRTEADIGANSDSVVQSCRSYPSGCSPSTAQYLTRPLPNNWRANDSTDCRLSSSQGRNSGSVKRSKEKMLPEGCRLVTVQTAAMGEKTVGERRTKNAKKRVSNTQEPWR
ncbi:ubiquitin carboxyl-terminal hydrolase 17-like protein C isoform X2 [Scophthalmus maximus]|uniref:ubiquitin carboxyl-terminal hydrolase 17-like protein C isoform X2 n=1 Tax=Scophthalmus maximus TaxID=52904 RepID=UPI0015E0E261|nr:ubiquitin carboxyl-terminal hydrolase 17-like protein C isoform X2 [Scophthalmus maximus]